MDNQKRKEFIQKVYVKDIKNAYTKVFLAINLMGEEKIEVNLLKILINNIDFLSRLFWINFDKIIGALRDFKAIKNNKEYEIIKEMWVNHLPKLIPRLEILKQKILKKQSIKNDLQNIFSIMERGKKLFEDLQTILYGEYALLSHNERTGLDTKGVL